MKAYLVLRDPYGEGAEVLAVYFGKEIAEHAVSLDETTEIQEIEVSESFAKTAVELSLSIAVRIAPDLPMTFSAGVTERLADTQETTRTIVDYGTNGATSSNDYEICAFGWGVDGDGMKATFRVVGCRGTNHADVRRQFDAALDEAQQKAVTA